MPDPKSEDPPKPLPPEARPAAFFRVLVTGSRDPEAV